MRHLPIAATLVITVIAALPWRAAADPSPAPSSGATTSAPTLRPATFEGVTPCADCPGIKLTIDLKSDGTYTLHRVYLERSGSLSEHGKWSYDANRTLLTLTPTKGSPELFRVTFTSTLHVLDASGNPLPATMNSTLSQVESNVSSLAGTGWTLVVLGGKPFVAQEQHPVTLQFDEAAPRVYGSGGCNQYNGPYTQTGDRLTVGVLAATRMMCENISGEDAYFAMLAKVASFVRTGEHLTLYDKNGTALAELGYEK